MVEGCQRLCTEKGNHFSEVAALALALDIVVFFFFDNAGGGISSKSKLESSSEAEDSASDDDSNFDIGHSLLFLAL